MMLWVIVPLVIFGCMGVSIAVINHDMYENVIQDNLTEEERKTADQTYFTGWLFVGSMFVIGSVFSYGLACVNEPVINN